MSKIRNWCFVWNNYTHSDIVQLWDEFGGQKSVKYLCFGIEVGESGTPHLQGYVDFINARTIGGLKKINKEIHWDARKGTWNQAVDYCKGLCEKKGNKLNPQFFEKGTPNMQGARNDIKNIVTCIQEGYSNRDIIEEHEDKALRIINHINTVRSIWFEQKRNWKMDVRIYYGPPGTGKTRAVFDEFGVDNIYVKMVGKWWDGYRGESCVLIDDFDPDGCFDITFDFYLKLMDRYPMRVEWKGGSGEFYSKTIIFTSNFDPDGWFPKKYNRNAFFRRVSDTRYFGHGTDTEVVVGNTMLPPPSPEIIEKMKLADLTIPIVGTAPLRGDDKPVVDVVVQQLCNSGVVVVDDVVFKEQQQPIDKNKWSKELKGSK